MVLGVSDSANIATYMSLKDIAKDRDLYCKGKDEDKSKAENQLKVLIQTIRYQRSYYTSSTRKAERDIAKFHGPSERYKIKRACQSD